MFGCAATSVLTSAVPASPRRRTSCAPNSHPTWSPADATTGSPCLKANVNVAFIRKTVFIYKKESPKKEREKKKNSNPSSSFLLFFHFAFTTIISRGPDRYATTRRKFGRRRDKREKRGGGHSNFPPVCLEKSDPIKDSPVPPTVSFHRFRDERRGLTFSVFLETAGERGREGQD